MMIMMMMMIDNETTDTEERMGRWVNVLAALLLADSAAGHGMLLHPPPRQAVDGTLVEFADGRFPATTDG